MLSCGETNNILAEEQSFMFMLGGDKNLDTGTDHGPGLTHISWSVSWLCQHPEFLSLGIPGLLFPCQTATNRDRTVAQLGVVVCCKYAGWLI